MQAAFFENLPFEIVMCFVTGRTIAFGRHSWFIAIIKLEGV